MQESAFGTFMVDASQPECAQYPVLQGAAADPFAVDADEQRSIRGPSRQSPGGGGALPRRAGEPGTPAIKIGLDDVDEYRFDRNSAVPIAFAVVWPARWSRNAVATQTILFASRTSAWPMLGSKM